jgi:hypothetical protein
MRRCATSDEALPSSREMQARVYSAGRVGTKEPLPLVE